MKANEVDISEESRRELAAGVLKQAAQDLLRCDTATSNIERELYLDAHRWLAADECSSAFSFLNICQLLDLAPEKVRQQLIGDSSLGAVDYWTQHCTRAARRVRTTFTQPFPNEHSASASIPLRHAETAT